jgi:hypothetical protein
VGQIPALVILDEIQDIKRFPGVFNFSSYANPTCLSHTVLLGILWQPKMSPLDSGFGSANSNFQRHD